MLNFDGLSESMVAEAKPFVVRVQSGGRGANSGANSGIGTGIVWRSNASTSEILTNFHVVAHTRHIRVVLSDDTEHEAEVTNRNPELDLAMLKINAGNLAPAPVADSSKLRVGEWVFAIGNPWGARDVVTQGIVSGFGKVGIRDAGRGTRRTAEYIRSDVVLAPGNSGGPLLNARGEVIGINAMILGGDLSVAIPSHVATEWVAGQPDKPVRLGIVVQPVLVPAKGFSLGSWAHAKQGLLVMDVELGGPAANVLMVGDVVLGVGGQAVENPDALAASVSRDAKRGNVRLNVLRGGALHDVDVSLVVV